MPYPNPRTKTASLQKKKTEEHNTSSHGVPYRSHHSITIALLSTYRNAEQTRAEARSTIKRPHEEAEGERIARGNKPKDSFSEEHFNHSEEGGHKRSHRKEEGRFQETITQNCSGSPSRAHHRFTLGVGS